MYSKKSQLTKVKKDNPKKMSKSENKKYREFISDIAKGKCQLCGNRGDDFHHSIWGRYGAEKDDRYQLLLCREHHEICHKDKYGFNSNSLKIAVINYMEYRAKYNDHKEWQNE